MFKRNTTNDVISDPLQKAHSPVVNPLTVHHMDEDMESTAPNQGAGNFILVDHTGRNKIG